VVKGESLISKDQIEKRIKSEIKTEWRESACGFLGKLTTVISKTVIAANGSLNLNFVE